MGCCDGKSARNDGVCLGQLEDDAGFGSACWVRLPLVVAKMAAVLVRSGSPRLPVGFVGKENENLSMNLTNSISIPATWPLSATTAANSECGTTCLAQTLVTRSGRSSKAKRRQLLQRLPDQRQRRLNEMVKRLILGSFSSFSLLLCATYPTLISWSL